jgi:hypothetical protein
MSPVKKYFRTPNMPEYPDHVKDLGELEGSWFEMGAQYGERAGEYIRPVFDHFYSRLIGRFDEERLLTDIQRYEGSISLFSPPAVEFMKGMAEGASGALNRSPFSERFGDYEKILVIACGNEFEFRHPDPKVRTISGAVEGKKNHGEEGCSSIAILGREGGARGDETLVAHNNDGPFGAMYNVFYVADPTDPRASRFWTLCLAGQLTFTGINENGLVIAETAGGALRPSDYDYGVPWQILTWHAIGHSKSVHDAAKTITVGTEDYRKRTGRGTVLRTGGCNFLLADRKSAAVLETTAHRYSIRLPGDAGEAGKYLILTNHNLTKRSLDEDNTETNVPMDFGVPEGSGLRFWTLMWLSKRNFGRMDGQLVRDFMSSHFNIAEDGTRRDYAWDPQYGWIPMHLSAAYSTTPCAHEGGYPEKYLGGTQESKVIAMREDEAEITFVQGRPCEWIGEWDRFRFELRRV